MPSLSVLYTVGFNAIIIQSSSLIHLVMSFHLQAFSTTAPLSNPEDISRIHLLGDTKEKYDLYINPTMMSDNGEYHCLYKTR